MVMDQFVTTYRKDYLWPYVRVLGHRVQEPVQRSDNVLCECHCLSQPRPTSEQATFGPNALKEESWSRLGPMGPLLDPKLYPAKVGQTPESETMRFNQPNVFLKKLQEKYPFIYECLRTAAPDDMISKINRDRLRSTYQVDYCKLQEYPTAPYEEILRAAGVQGLAPCPEPVRLPGDPCRPNQKPIAFRPATITKIPKTGERCGKGIALYNPFKKDRIPCDVITETWGKMIYRDTMHAHGSMSTGRRRRLK